MRTLSLIPFLYFSLIGVVCAQGQDFNRWTVYSVKDVFEDSTLFNAINPHRSNTALLVRCKTNGSNIIVRWGTAIQYDKNVQYSSVLKGKIAVDDKILSINLPTKFRLVGNGYLAIDLVLEGDIAMKFIDEMKAATKNITIKVGGSRPYSVSAKGSTKAAVFIKNCMDMQGSK